MTPKGKKAGEIIIQTHTHIPTHAPTHAQVFKEALNLTFYSITLALLRSG